MKSEKLYFFLSTLVNLSLVLVMMLRVEYLDSDKAILILLFYFPILIITNGTIWGILILKKKKLSNAFKFNTLLLLILFIPAIFLGIVL